MSEPLSHKTRVTIALAIVYLVWGSSYLATKIMVTDEPPLVAAGLRFGLAGVLLLTFAWWRSGPPVLTRTEIRHIIVMGLLAVLFANACHVIAMQHVQSNTAALLNATPALWIAWLGTFGHRRSHLSRTARVGLIVGLAGVMLVLAPKGGFHLAGLGWQLLILLGCLSWSLSTIYYRNSGSANPPVMFTGLQMLAGSLGLLAGAWLSGESFDIHWTGRGFAAFAWLVVMSACVGYTAYVWLATHTTPVVVGSYGYVNPAVAALVGWLVLGETLGWTQIAGMLVILLGVALATGYLTPMPRNPTPAPEG
jgi:drug/metabolite transporter (DMT)-like permease